MATAKPRVTVTLDPHTYDVLRRAGQVNNQSISRVIADLLDSTLPTVERVVEAGEKFQALSEDMRDRVRRNFQSADERISPAVAEVTRDLFDVLDTLGHYGEDPRPSNTGVYPPSSVTTGSAAEDEE